ncbi:MAG: hypothetical protein HYY18_17875 [Planctomycetes bacterium]|nr:hypothetical protein [Planctomycetota bacterium]
MRTLLLAAAFLLVAGGARAENLFLKGKAAHEAGRFEDAVEALRRHTEAYPEDVEGYRWLAASYEKLGRSDEAVQAWKDFRTLAVNKADVAMADAKIAAATGAAAPKRDRFDLSPEEIRAMSSSDAAWHEEETKHFKVRTHNVELTKFIGKQAEHYLAVLCDRFLGGAAYPRQVPLSVFRDHNEYVGAGYPAWSGGGTIADYQSLDAFVSGKVGASIALFQLGRDGKLNPELSEPVVLPHELTHLVLGEHFGQTPLPVWINEGVAQLVQFEGRERADDLLAPAVAKNPACVFKLRDLVASGGYPKDPAAIGAFYYQSVSFLGWIHDTCGEEKLRQFLAALKKGRSAEDALKPLFPSASGKDWLDRVHEDWVKAMQASVEKRKAGGGK